MYYYKKQVNKMHRKLLLAVVMLLLVFGSTATLTAQSQVAALEPVQLINVPVTEELLITIPEDWLTWRRSDFDTLAEADAAVNALFESLEPSGTFSISTNEITLFYALKPEPTSPMMTFLRVDLLGLDRGAMALQIPPEDVKAEDIMTLVNQEVWESSEVNGRSTAYGNVLIQSGLGIIVTTIFPEQNLLSQVQFFTSADWGLENLYLVTLVQNSLRVNGEDIDFDYIAYLMESTPVPDSILLPPAADEAADADEETPEPQAAGEGEAEAAAVTCTVSASSNVNLRGGPGTAFAVVGSLTGNTNTAATGQATGSDGRVWWQLESGAWVRSDVVTETGACDLLPTVTAP